MQEEADEERLEGIKERFQRRCASAARRTPSVFW